MLKSTIIFILILALLYALRVHVVVDTLDGLAHYWNTTTVFVMTFKDRHPLIFAFLPFACFALLVPNAKLQNT